MSLSIDYNKVESKLAKIKSTLSNNDIAADYNHLLSDFSKSKGEEATAIRDMIAAEIAMAWQLNSTLNKFANGIQGAVNEFKKLDQDTKKAMTGGEKSSHNSRYSSGGSRRW